MTLTSQSSVPPPCRPDEVRSPPPRRCRCGVAMVTDMWQRRVWMCVGELMHEPWPACCLYSFVRRKTVAVRIIDHDEYDKQASFFIELQQPYWNRRWTGVKRHCHLSDDLWPFLQLPWGTLFLLLFSLHLLLLLSLPPFSIRGPPIGQN